MFCLLSFPCFQKRGISKRQEHFHPADGNAFFEYGQREFAYAFADAECVGSLLPHARGVCLRKVVEERAAVDELRSEPPRKILRGRDAPTTPISSEILDAFGADEETVQVCPSSVRARIAAVAAL